MALILAILELYSEQRTQENYRKEIQAKKGIKIPIQQRLNTSIYCTYR